MAATVDGQVALRPHQAVQLDRITFIWFMSHFILLQTPERTPSLSHGSGLPRLYSNGRG